MNDGSNRNSTLNTPLTCLALGAAWLLAAGLPARAALIAYEGFNAATETANIVGTGADSGTGFSGLWMDSVGNGTIHRMGDNAGITAFPGNVYFPVPAGGKARHVSGYSPKTVIRPLERPLDLDADGEFYLSFLANDNAGLDRDYDMRVFVGREANVDSGDPGLRLHVGLTYACNGNDAVGISHRDATEKAFCWAATSGFSQVFSSATFGGVGDDSLYFIVARFQTSGGDVDTISLKAYPFTPGDGTLVDVDPESVAWDVTYSAYLTGTLEYLGISSEGVANPDVDELRLGETWSDVADTNPPQVPVFMTQPASQTLALGLNATFNVLVAGSEPITYRWQKESGGTFVNLNDGGAISGATTPTLTLAGVQLADAGNYRVIVNNPDGSITSAVAALTVVGQPTNTISLHAAIAVFGTVGFHYRVEYREALSAPEAWQLLQDIPALPSTPFVVFDPADAALSSKRFYRSVLVP